MNDNQRTTLVPHVWLKRVVRLLNAMAEEGIGMGGCEDPADLMCEIATYLGVGEDDDMWGAVMGRLANA